LLLVGDYAYLGDVMTFPAYRRRGQTAAFCRHLLDDAMAGVARRCILVSTPVAHMLYAGLVSTNVMSIVGFQSLHV
jgi:hypothetical protein